jgi:hypothetical protein
MHNTTSGCLSLYKLLPLLAGDKGTLEAQQGPADTAFAERSGAGGRAKTRFPQAADFIGNVSARQGGGESRTCTLNMPPHPTLVCFFF